MVKVCLRCLSGEEAANYSDSLRSAFSCLSRSAGASDFSSPSGSLALSLVFAGVLSSDFCSSRAFLGSTLECGSPLCLALDVFALELCLHTCLKTCCPSLCHFQSLIMFSRSKVLKTMAKLVCYQVVAVSWQTTSLFQLRIVSGT